MIYLTLFYEFFKIGLFSVGGGLATLPFLAVLSSKYGWYTTSMLADMLAISESTPGAIGINMATYSGYYAAGVLGGIVATLSLTLPALIIIVAIAKFLNKFKTNRYVESCLCILRPAVTALILNAIIEVYKVTFLDLDSFEEANNLLSIIDVKSFILFFMFFAVMSKIKIHPFFYILAGGLIGLFLF